MLISNYLATECSECDTVDVDQLCKENSKLL